MVNVSTAMWMAVMPLNRTLKMVKMAIIMLYICVLKDFMYLFLERGEGKEKERERNINVWLPLMYPLLGTWPSTLACALDWESNQQPIGLQSGTQSTELHQRGPVYINIYILIQKKEVTWGYPSMYMCQTSTHKIETDS